MDKTSQPGFKQLTLQRYKMKKSKNGSLATQQGFTLIELILYIGIITLILSSVVTFAWNVIYGRVRSQVQVEVNQDMKLVANRIAYELRTATDINSISANSISLAHEDTSRNPTEITLNGDTIEIGFGSGGECPTTSPCELVGNNVIANSLFFTDLSTANAKTVKFEFSLSYDNPDNLNQYEATADYESSVNLRSY